MNSVSILRYGFLATVLLESASALSSRKPEVLAVPDGPENFPDELHATITSMSAFIKKSPKDDASLVMMGDSTMRTLGGMLGKVGGVVHRAYVSNDGLEGAKYEVMGEGDGIHEIAVGEDWVNPKYADHFATKRAMSANKLLHSKGCNWGGPFEVQMGNGALEGLVIFYWGFIPEWSAQGCWKSCMADAVRVLRPRAMVWNVGLHTLNEKFDVDTCQKRTGHAESFCSDYEGMVEAATKDLVPLVPTLIWKTTNHVCDSKLQGLGRVPFGREWGKPMLRVKLETECHKNCTAFRADESCYDYLMSGQSTKRMRSAWTAALSKFKSASDVHILDSYSLTEACCQKDCDESHDGLHYTGKVDATLMKDLAGILADSRID